MKTSFKILFLLACFGLLIWDASAQQLSIKPFAINQSNLIGELKELKNSTPSISADDFAKSANSRLEKQGLNFIVGLDPATCQKIEQIKKAQKTLDAPLNLRTTLKSPLGEPATLSLPEAEFSKSECFACFINLAFLEITDKDFVTTVQGNNVKFFLPANFLLNEAVWVDEKNLAIIKRRWRIPAGATPLSISDDGNILYFEFEDPELKDLTLAAFGEGVYQFFLKKELDAGKKRIVMSNPQNNNDSTKFSFIKFESSQMNQIVKFPMKCQN